MTKELPHRRQKFVNEYLADPSKIAKNAAIRAGYSPKTAYQQSVELMKIPEIRAAIEEGEKNLSERTGITPDRIMAELAKIGFANVKDLADLTEDGKSIRDLPADKTAAISEYSVESTEGRDISTKKSKVKLLDKRAALIDMGKQIGMWRQQLDITGHVDFAKLVEDSIIDVEAVEVPQIEPPKPDVS